MITTHNLPPTHPPIRNQPPSWPRDPRWSINRRAPRLLWCTNVTIMWRVRKIGRLLCECVVSSGAKCECVVVVRRAHIYPPIILYNILAIHRFSPELTDNYNRHSNQTLDLIFFTWCTKKIPDNSTEALRFRKIAPCHTYRFSPKMTAVCR